MKIFITYSFLLFSASLCFGQQESSYVKGIISNYAKQPLQLYRCYGDTILFVDSIRTDKNGAFSFFNTSPGFSQIKNFKGLYKVFLQYNQFFYLILNSANSYSKGGETDIEIKTTYNHDVFYNIASDSLKIIKSEENRRFYEFQNKQQQINTANFFLLRMMRLYPIPDPFHKQIEDEYFKRYAAMDLFVKGQQKDKKIHGFENLAGTIAKAYYQPVNPDWRQPDSWRDSIIASHFFDLFNPADSFYINSNILPEKMDLYLSLLTNKRDSYGQQVYDENAAVSGVKSFLEKIKSNQENFEFCLNYLLKKFNKEHKESVFLFLNDNYLKNEQNSCAPADNSFNWAREKASVIRGVQVGSMAPDFSIMKDKLTMYQLSADYTLIVFWASWCPHCVEEVPKIKKAIENFLIQGKEKNNEGKQSLGNVGLASIFVSLDNEEKPWADFINKSDLGNFINLCEFKGWNGQIGKSYNVYATPTLFLLDKDKKIIAKPENTEQLINSLKFGQ